MTGTSKNWSPLEFNRAQLDGLLELRALVFAGENYSSSRWTWEYEDNPQGPAFIRLAADAKEPSKLAGHYAVISYQMNMKSRKVLACQSLDTFTDPNFRNQGIFAGLAASVYSDAIEKGVELIFGFPNSSSFPGFVKKLGFTSTFSLFHYIRPLTMNYFFKRAPWLKVSWLAKKIRFPLSKPPSEFTFLPLTKIPADWQELLSAFESQFDFQVKRDAAYMEWRYLQCPDRKYELFELRASGRLCGLAVLRMEGGTGHLVDLLAANSASWKALVQHACFALRLRGAECAAAYLQPGAFLEKLFRSFHFRRRGKGTPFIFRQLGNSTLPEKIGDAKSWFLSGGDTDYL